MEIVIAAFGNYWHCFMSVDNSVFASVLAESHFKTITCCLGSSLFQMEILL